MDTFNKGNSYCRQDGVGQQAISSQCSEWCAIQNLLTVYFLNFRANIFTTSLFTQKLLTSMENLHETQIMKRKITSKVDYYNARVS